MSTNYIRKNLGSHKWDGYSCFRVYADHKGELFPGGAKYVVFDHGNLIAEVDTLTEAAKAWECDTQRSTVVKLKDYLGIDARLRS